MKIYNNNDAYGWCGPFESESFESLADEMMGTFREWAAEIWDRDEDDAIDLPRGEFIAEEVDRMRAEFIAGLTEVASGEDGDPEE